MKRNEESQTLDKLVDTKESTIIARTIDIFFKKMNIIKFGDV